MYPNTQRASLVLAPMDGVTDPLMRSILTEICPFTHCVTEFVRVSSLVVPPHTFLTDVPELRSASQTRNGTPVQVQLLGGDPERLAQSAQVAVSLGATGIDINFGCPAPTVNRHDGGATLLKFPERIEAIVSTVRSALPAHVPVSAKLRLGWDDPRAILGNAERAARGGAAWITIHGRTKMQGYTPPAYWKPIGEVQRALSIPVVANGEIWTVDDLKRCIDESNCRHIMVGRGSLARPAFINDCARELGLPTRNLDESTYCWSSLVARLIAEATALGEREVRILSRAKQWLNYAHKQGCCAEFEGIKRLSSIAELCAVLGVLPSQREAQAA
jgi:tRNA-dihydrouridine synthase C